MPHRRQGRDPKRIKSGVLSAAQVPRLEQKLGALMPYTIPLLRRIQFHLAGPVSETARVFVAVADDASDGIGVNGSGNGDLDASGDEQSSDEDDDDDGLDIDAWLASIAPSTSIRSSSASSTGNLELEPGPGPTSTASAGSTSARPWIAAHIDLAHYGQTQVWTFASWEAAAAASCRPKDLFPDPHSKTITKDSTLETETETRTPQPQIRLQDEFKTGPEPEDTDPRHRSLMIALFRYIYHDLIPRMPTEPDAEWLELQRTGKSLTIPYSRNKILFGTINTQLLPWIPDPARTRIDAGYLKYIFAVDHEHDDGNQGNPLDNDKDSKSTKYSHLPPGYTFGPMQQAHLQTVLDRSVIPRTLALLQRLPSLGVFLVKDSNNISNSPTRSAGDEHGPNLESTDTKDLGAPVAWGFLGKDASLSSLHTEPAYRGQGLAGCLGRELLRRSAWGSDVAGSGLNSNSNYNWAHADVSIQNMASRRVMEKLGGVPMWKVAWVEVNMGIALEALENR